MEIKKISYTPKNGVKISYNLNENEESVSYVKKSDAVPTMDFQNAVQKFKHHMIALTEYASFIDCEDPIGVSEKDITKSFVVTEIQLTGEGEEEKVIIIGKKELVNKLTIPIKTLKTALYNTDDYEYSGNLAEAVEKLVEEAKLYLDGKHQDKPKQLEMELSHKELEDELEEEDAI